MTGCNFHHIICSDCITRVILLAKFPVAEQRSATAELVWQTGEPRLWYAAMHEFAACPQFYEPKIEDRLTVLLVLLREACQQHSRTRFCLRDMWDCMEHVTRSACPICYARADMENGVSSKADETPAMRAKRLADVPHWVDWIEKLTPVSPLLLGDSCERFMAVMAPRFLPSLDLETGIVGAAFAGVSASEGLDLKCPLGCERRIPLAGTKFASIRRLLQLNLEDLLFEILRHALTDCEAESICEPCRALGYNSKQYTLPGPRALMEHLAVSHFKNAPKPVSAAIATSAASGKEAKTDAAGKTLSTPSTSAMDTPPPPRHLVRRTSREREEPLAAAAAPEPDDAVAPPRQLPGQDGEVLVAAEPKGATAIDLQRKRHLLLKSARERNQVAERHRKSSFYLSDDDEDNDDDVHDDHDDHDNAAEVVEEDHHDEAKAQESPQPSMIERRITRGMSMQAASTRSPAPTPTRPTRSTPSGASRSRGRGSARRSGTTQDSDPEDPF